MLRTTDGMDLYYRVADNALLTMTLLIVDIKLMM